MSDKVRSTCGLSVLPWALAALNVRSAVRAAARSLVALVLATPGVRSNCALGALDGPSLAWASREAQPLRGWGPRPSSEEAHGADVRTRCGLGSFVSDERGRRRLAAAAVSSGAGRRSVGAVVRHLTSPSLPSSGRAASRPAASRGLLFLRTELACLTRSVLLAHKAETPPPEIPEDAFAARAQNLSAKKTLAPAGFCR